MQQPHSDRDRNAMTFMLNEMAESMARDAFDCHTRKAGSFPPPEFLQDLTKAYRWLLYAQRNGQGLSQSMEDWLLDLHEESLLEEGVRRMTAAWAVR